MKIITLFNQKGGVGKSSLTFNLAYQFSKLGKTLMWDFDVQESLSLLSGSNRSSSHSFMELIKKNKRIKKSIFPTRCSNLYIIPATEDLREIVFELANEKSSKMIVSSIVEKLKDEFTFLFIDPQPSQSLLSQNILKAADAIYIPLIPNPLNYQILDNNLEFIKKTGTQSKIKSFILNMTDLRKSNHKETIARIKENYPGYYREPFIPSCSKMEEIVSRHQPLERFAGRTKAAQKIRELAQVMIEELYSRTNLLY